MKKHIIAKQLLKIAKQLIIKNNFDKDIQRSNQMWNQIQKTSKILTQIYRNVDDYKDISKKDKEQLKDNLIEVKQYCNSLIIKINKVIQDF